MRTTVSKLNFVKRKYLISIFVLALAYAPNTFAGGNSFFESSNSDFSGTGNAIETNKVLQRIDPWPENAQNTEIDIDGNRILNAMERLESRRSKTDSSNVNTTTQGMTSTTSDTSTTTSN